MKAYIPAIVFLLVSGIGIVGVLLWRRKFSDQARTIQRQIASAAALRQGDQDQHIRFEAANQLPIIEWINQRLEKYAALRLLLIRADTEKTAAEFVLLSLGLMIVSILLAVQFFRPGLLGLFNVGLIAAVFPWWYLSGKAKKRRARFEDQLPEALDFISRSLKAGHGLTASMGMAGDELPAPVGKEFKATFDEINFGVPFPEAMANLMARVNSPDLNFFTVAVVIQRETGGNLTELLANLSKLIRERIKLKGKIRVLASEGRFSGILLGALPFVLSALLTALNPRYMSTLWTTPEGHSLVITGLVMMTLGAFFMHRIIQIKV